MSSSFEHITDSINCIFSLASPETCSRRSRLTFPSRHRHHTSGQKKKKTWGTSGSKAGNPACVTRDAYAGCRPFLSFPFLSFSALSQPDVLICISFAGRTLYSVREMKQGRRRRCKMMMQCLAERERRQVHVTWTWPYNNDGLPVRFLLLSVVAASQQARPCPLSPHECPIPCHQ